MNTVIASSSPFVWFDAALWTRVDCNLAQRWLLLQHGTQMCCGLFIEEYCQISTVRGADSCQKGLGLANHR
jgi:hypothetical protein